MDKHPIPHPSWCHRPNCEVNLGRFHSSEVLTVVRDKRGGSTARLGLRLYQNPGHPIFVELVVGDHESAHRCRVDLSQRQAEALRSGLAVLLGRIN